ncbi:hypothetical protein ABFT23_09290 [Nocardioides sp. C4-1]|uniref:hypothetical protein n=1 Tax=Nocardioides sp. C4-1 TaxID=3151851 RepID=UPI003265FBB3
MSTRPRRDLGLAAAVVTGCLLLSACGGGSAGNEAAGPTPTPSGTTTTTPPGDAAGQSAPPPAVPSLPEVTADLAGDLQGVLDARAAAVLHRDRPAFLAGLADDEALRTTEGGYFDNLAQLPISIFAYRLEPASLVRTDGAYWAVVTVDLQLAPYDVAPVRTADRIQFVPADPHGVQDGRFRISSTTDPRWEVENLPVQQPWDTEPVTVREGAGVLAVFDTADDAQAAGVVAAVERGIADISARVPYPEWGSRAVVYALGDPRFLDDFDDLPGGDPQALDGVAFTVPSGTDPAVPEAAASTRIALSPALLPAAASAQPDVRLDRLVRHELAHVAIGQHDDGAPVWLSEGIAEWLSVQALAPDQRQVPAEALRAARRGIDAMPGDAEFNDDAAVQHYALAWWVCEWLVRTYDAQAPFVLLDHLAARPDDDPEAVVEEVLRQPVDAIARQAARLMVQTYAPATPAPAPTPAPTPGTPPVPGSTPTVSE